MENICSQDFLLNNHCSHFQIGSSGIKKDWSAGVIWILRWIQHILIIRWIWQNCGIFHVHCPQSPRTKRVTFLREVRNYEFSFFAFLPLWHWSWSEIVDFRAIWCSNWKLKSKVKNYVEFTYVTASNLEMLNGSSSMVDSRNSFLGFFIVILAAFSSVMSKLWKIKKFKFGNKKLAWLKTSVLKRS